jgi:hypothetical protein
MLTYDRLPTQYRLSIEVLTVVFSKLYYYLHNQLIIKDMGEIKNGVLGGFSGKAGSVIGYIVRGKSYIRGLNKKRVVKSQLLPSWPVERGSK